MAQFQLNISPILALVHFIHPACARLISLVANILATSVREGMLRDTRQAIPARTVKVCKGTNCILGRRRLMVLWWSG